MQQQFVTERIEQDDAHLFAIAGHPRAEEVLVRERIGVFRLERKLTE